MAISKYGYKSAVRLLPETAYGTNTKVWTGSDVFGDMTADFTPNVNVVDRMYRSGTLMDVPCNKVTGRKSGTISLTGTLTYDKVAFFQGLVMDNDATSPITIGSQSATGYSFTVIRDYGNDTGMVAVGGVVESVEISPDDTLWNITVTMRVQDISMDESLTSGYTGTKPDVSCKEPFLVSGISGFATDYDIVNPSSISLSLTNEFVDDAVSYGISTTKSFERVIKTNGECTISTVYDDDISMPAIGETTNTEFTLSDGTNELAFVLNGTVTEVSIPDVERDVYVMSYTTSLANSTSVATDAFELTFD